MRWAWLVGAIVGCAVPEEGAVELRVFLAPGPGALDLAVSVRVGVIGGETVDVPVEQAFANGVGIPVEGDGAVHQVRLEGIASDGSVVGRGESPPTLFDPHVVTLVDVVLRPVEVFSGGIGGLVVPKNSVQIAADGQGAFVVGSADSTAGPDRLDLVDPWLSTVEGRDAPESSTLGPVVALARDGVLYLLSGNAGSRFEALGAAGSVVVEGAPVFPGATVVETADAWVLLGGLDPAGAPQPSCRVIREQESGLISEVCTDLQWPRRAPVAAYAGEALVVVGGAPFGGYGEVLAGFGFDGPPGIPSAAVAYGPASAVLVGDGSDLVLSWSNGSFGVAGHLAIARSEAALARLPDGRLLVAGGADAEQSLSAEILTLGEGAQFTSGGLISLLAGRLGARLVPLVSGDILLVGGVDLDGRPAQWLEVFAPRVR